MKKEIEVFIAFLGNAYFDSRIVNLRESFNKYNISFSVTSFNLSTDIFNPPHKDFKVYDLSKYKNRFLFYFHFFLNLIKDLIITRAKFYIAEDIYTLPFVLIFGKLRQGKVYYNSRELYPFLAGLRNKKRIQVIIAFIERIFIKFTDLVITTGEMDSEFLEEYYKLDSSLVLRNLPRFNKSENPFNYRKEFSLPEKSKILLYQGMILEGRGIVPIIEILSELPDTYFFLLGEGPFKDKFLKLADEKNVKSRIFFLGRKNQDELINFTAGADFGLSLIENISKSYYYALPNKLFEYIMAELPVISSNLPQMKKIIDKYNIGIVLDSFDKSYLIETINNFSVESKNKYKNNCKIASIELNWDKEFIRFRPYLSL